MIKKVHPLFRLLFEKAPVVIDGRLLHGGRTGIGRISKLMIEAAAEARHVYVLGASGEVAFKNVTWLETKCDHFGPWFLLQNFLLNFLVFSRPRVIFPHYFSALCFIRKFVFVHDIMAITDHEKFHSRFSGIKRMVLKQVVGIGLANADVACPSNFSCDALDAEFHVRAECLPNGTLLDAGNPATLARADEAVPSRPLTVGYVGNRRPHKNLPGLQQFCDNNGYRLEFFDQYKPAQDHDDALLAEFIQQVDAIALFSHCEGFGIPIVEGALFGKYVFCSKIPVFFELAEVGINFVGVDTVVTDLVPSRPAVVDQRYRFQKMTAFIRHYVS